MAKVLASGIRGSASNLLVRLLKRAGLTLFFEGSLPPSGAKLASEEAPMLANAEDTPSP